MQCVCLEIGKDEDKTKTCLASVETSPWNVDSDALSRFCEKDEFQNCPRLIAFMNYKLANNALNVKTN